MYELQVDGSFKKAYKKLTKAEQKATDAKLVLLAADPWHSSLRVKKILSTPFFECSVNMDVRIAFLVKDGKLIVLLDIDHHDALLDKARRRKK